MPVGFKYYLGGFEIQDNTPIDLALLEHLKYLIEGFEWPDLNRWLDLTFGCKLRMHGVSKRRTWRKLHVGTNPEDGELQAVLLTENNVSDDQAVEKLLEQIEQTIIDFAADGAYDKRKVYDSLNAHSPDVNILIPPRRNAHIWKHGNTKTEHLKRDENLRSIRKDGRKAWKKNSGYHVRSLA